MSIIIIIITIITSTLVLVSFLHQISLMVFHWSLRGRKSPQVSKTLLNILADSNNAVVLVVLIRSPISNFSYLLSKCHVISHWEEGDKITTTRIWIDSIKPSKKVTVKEGMWVTQGRPGVGT